MVKVFIFVSAVLIFLACRSERSASSTVGSVNIVKHAELRLGLDTETPVFAYNTTLVHENGKDFIIDLNHVANTVNVYDARDGNLAHVFRFPTEGPYSITQLQSFFAFDADSIVGFPKWNIVNAVATNRDGACRYLPGRQQAEIEGSHFINHASTAAAPVIRSGNRWHFIRYPRFNIYDARNMNGSFRWAFAFDSTGLELLDVTLPAAMQDRAWTNFATVLGRIKGHGDHLLYNWPALDSIQVTGPDTAYWVVAAATESYPDLEPLPSSPDAPPPAESLYRTAMEGKLYPHLYYDSYQKCYFRFLRIPQSYDTRMAEGYDALATQDLLLIALDTAFQKIAELRLPSRTYSSFPCFAGPAGFYIPKLNPLYESLVEDRREYGIFRVVGN